MSGREENDSVERLQTLEKAFGVFMLAEGASLLLSIALGGSYRFSLWVLLQMAVGAKHFWECFAIIVAGIAVVWQRHARFEDLYDRAQRELFEQVSRLRDVVQELGAIGKRMRTYQELAVCFYEEAVELADKLPDASKAKQPIAELKGLLCEFKKYLEHSEDSLEGDADLAKLQEIISDGLESSFLSFWASKRKTLRKRKTAAKIRIKLLEREKKLHQIRLGFEAIRERESNLRKRCLQNLQSELGRELPGLQLLF